MKRNTLMGVWTTMQLLVVGLILMLILARVPMFRAEIEEGRYERYSITDWMQMRVLTYDLWEVK